MHEKIGGMKVSVAERRAFLRTVGGAYLAALAAPVAGTSLEALQAPAAPSGQASGPSQSVKARKASTRPRGSEFVFARVRYTSGDWDFNPKVAANVLNSIVEYTTVPVYRDEVVITLDSQELFAFPFLFMTGHKLVRFSKAERDNLTRYVERGGLLFSDDCNHDVAGLYAQSFEHEMRTVFPAPARRSRRSRTRIRSIAPSSSSRKARPRPHTS